MTENFEALLNDNLQGLDFKPGAIIKATVKKVDRDNVIVDAGLKTEALIPTEEFYNLDGEFEVQEGDSTEVAVEDVENGFGETRLSREKARKAEAWRELEVAYENGQTIKGTIIERVKGGFTVSINHLRAFLPGSLVDVRPVRDPSYLEEKELDFKIIKMDTRRNNIVVSRRAVVAQETEQERQALIENLVEGQVVNGIVKNITDYGAFIDLGGIDGLLHITDMSWTRIKHPSELLTIGEEVTVKILKFDRDKQRVSLGMKQLGEDPWLEVSQRYPVGTKLVGQVTNVTDYGCFVEIESGIEGLVHMSEMDWTNKNIHPSKVVQIGDEVEVMVLDIDEERRRISLGIKQCQSNPWEEFAANHEVGEKISGEIRSITDFGIFIGLEGGIDGLVHLSDISWSEPAEKALRQYNKGEVIETVILAMDPERERISLGIKQLTKDPLEEFAENHPEGSALEGEVVNVTAKGASVRLENGIEGYIKASDISKGRIKDTREYLNQGQNVEAQITSVDRKNRLVYLSMKELEGPSEEEKATGTTRLGDILKEQIQGQQNNEDDQ